MKMTMQGAEKGTPDVANIYEAATLVKGGRVVLEHVENQYGATFQRSINPARRIRKATGLSGRQWKKHRRAQRAHRRENL